jgi:MFS family permease
MFVLADTVSTLGTEMAAVALPWFVLVSTGSAARAGSVLAAEYLGTVLCGIPSGPLAMRLGPKRTLVVSDVARAALVALIPVLHATGSLTLPLLLVIAFAVGGFFAPYSSASWLSMSRLVDDDEARLTRVAGLFGAAQEAAAFLGPALGGVLVVAWGAVQVLVLDAASFAVPALVVAVVVPSSGRTAEAEEKGGITDGLRWLAGHRSLARRVIGAGVQNTGWTAMMLTLPVMALHRFHGDARLAGWFVAAYGAGSVAGGLAVTRLGSPSDRTATNAIWGFAASTWLLPAAPWPWMVIAAVAGCGVGNGVFYARFFATLTVRVPEEMNAKVMTTVTVALSATGPVGFVAAGQLLQRTGSATACLLGIAVVSTAGAGVVATSYGMADVT